MPLASRSRHFRRHDMRFEGTLTQWNEDRGFGFIEAAQTRERLFVHICAFARGRVRPPMGARLNFRVERDARGRRRVVDVVMPGDTLAVSAPPARERATGPPCVSRGAAALAGVDPDRGRVRGRGRRRAAVAVRAGARARLRTSGHEHRAAHDDRDTRAAVQLRRPHHMFEDALLRRGDLDVEPLHGDEDGRQPRWRPMRAAVVHGRALKTRGRRAPRITG